MNAPVNAEVTRVVLECSFRVSREQNVWDECVWGALS